MNVRTVAVLALLVAACGTDYVDTAKLEQTIREGVGAQMHITVTSVHCPENRVFKLGDVFECTARLADGRGLTVTVSNPDGGGNLRYQVTAVEQ
jgi:hypothetical protein